ncbi:hypothetical protein V1508DRAFT_415199, partial [Lipomyces doorenjongii]|uniref:uncharacterized protein n=1 Tax=Lipomyces doorenjongii TaxID=383834 RepID=UPI0034CF7135
MAILGFYYSTCCFHYRCLNLWLRAVGYDVQITNILPTIGNAIALVSAYLLPFCRILLVGGGKYVLQPPYRISLAILFLLSGMCVWDGNLRPTLSEYWLIVFPTVYGFRSVS